MSADKDRIRLFRECLGDWAGEVGHGGVVDAVVTADLPACVLPRVCDRLGPLLSVFTLSPEQRELLSSMFHSGFRELSCIRSEEHTSELQSRFDLVCRLLLENTTHTGRRRDH